MSETKNEERDKMLRTRNHTFKLNKVEDDKLKTLRDITGLSISEIVRNTLFSEQSILSSGHISNAEEFKKFRQAQVTKNSYRMMSSCDEELEEVERLLKELITDNEEVINKIWHQQ